MSSGLVMRRAGKSVVVFEKTKFFGGTTSKSGCVMWIPNNRFMSSGEDSPAKAITYLEAVVGDDSDAPGTSKEKRLAYVTEAPRSTYTRVDPSVKREVLESIVAPKLRSGRFKATDKLIASLKPQTFMRRQ
jgi:FAD binding domain